MPKYTYNFNTGSSGANTSMVNLHNSLSSLQDALYKKNALDERTKQQEFTNRLATEANARQQWAAQAKGMGQGQLVTEAMKGITSRTNVLDSTNAMEALNKTYLKAGTDTKMSKSVSKLDKSVGYNEAMKGILGNKELTPEQAAAAEEAVKQGVLGNDYDLYKKLTGTAGSNVETINNNVDGKDYSELYKTTDVTAVKNALVDQLVKGGVNPVYADKVATEKASQYVATTPKWTENDKQKVAMWDKELASLNKNTVSITDGTGKNGKSKVYSQYKINTTAPQPTKIQSAMGAAASNLGIDNGWLNFSGEKKDLPNYMKVAQEPIKLKDGRVVYATPDDVAGAMTDATKTGNWFSYNQLKNPTAFKDALVNQVTAHVQQADKYKKSGGTYGSSTTTNKQISKAARGRIDEITKLKTALINTHATPIGQNVADYITGARNGIIPGTIDLNGISSKPVTSANTQKSKKPKANVLLAALNSSKKGEVAKVILDNANNIEKLNALKNALNPKDKKRLEKVSNSQYTQQLLQKALTKTTAPTPPVQIPTTQVSPIVSNSSSIYGSSGKIVPTTNNNPRASKHKLLNETISEWLSRVFNKPSTPSTRSVGAPRNR